MHAITRRSALAAGICAGGFPLRGAPPSVWTVGIYTGPSPLRLSQPANVTNPVLRAPDVTDMKVDALAHPFMIITGNRYYLFFTAKDLKTDKGGIGMAESADGLHWKFRRTVIREEFVTSHPFVFQWKNDFYLIPENHTEPSIRLYRATSFPDQWKYERDLLKGDHYISPTLARYKNIWWMFVAPPGNNTLRLFYAADFKGPWTEHPQSPIVKSDPRTARPGGRPFVLDGSLYRLAQDGVPKYGSAVRAFQITEITQKTYADKMIEPPVVKYSGEGWNAEGMHHVDAHQTGKDRWIAAVDALGACPSNHSREG